MPENTHKDPIICEASSFSDWREIRYFLASSPLHFVTCSEPPDIELPEQLQSQIIIVRKDRSAYFYAPQNVTPEALLCLCRMQLAPDQNPMAGPDLAGFLQKFADQLIREFDLKNIADSLMAEAAKLFDAEGAAMLVLDRDEDVMRFAAIHSEDTQVGDKIEKIMIPTGSGIAGWVCEHRKVLIVNDVQEDGRFYPQADIEADYHTRNMLAAPILIGDEILGVLEIVNRRNFGFSDWDIPTISVLATVIAVFVEKDYLNRERQDFARVADRAETANSVLHNIGNVLNSVNVSCSLASSKLEKSRLTQFHMANKLLKEHMDDLGDFFTNHPKGKLLPQFLLKLGDELQKEQDILAGEIAKIANKTNTMRDIIETQQTLAKMGSSDAQDLIAAIDEAVSTQRELIEKQHVSIRKNILSGKPIRAQHAKLVHILINLIKNAVEAMEDLTSTERVIDIEIGETGEAEIYCKITDHGVGMPTSVQEKLFVHGFTTKKDGHGFGLASCAKAMQEMSGKIYAESDGPGKGSSFYLVFPVITTGSE